MAKVIGFVGVDKYDIILYLAKLLVCNKYRVLVIDDSDTQALQCSVNYPKGLNPHETEVEYAGFRFLTRVDLANIDYNASYDFVLIDFGFCLNHHNLLQCDAIQIFTDIKRHNIYRLISKNFVNFLSNAMDKDHPQTNVIIRDWVSSKLSLGYMHELLRGLGVGETSYYQFDFNEEDYALQLQSQYDTNYNFKRVSAPIKAYLVDTLVNICEFSESVAEKSFKTFAGVLL